MGENGVPEGRKQDSGLTGQSYGGKPSLNEPATWRLSGKNVTTRWRAYESGPN